MLSRALRVPRAVPLRAVPAAISARSVTTNAASASLSHSVPQSDDERFAINLSDESFETYELDPPPYTLEVTKKELKQMYYDMVSIRYVRV
ncbi:Pyruvate dehydrogenase E1 component subunit alpha-like protein [Ilyonectria robusta]